MGKEISQILKESTKGLLSEESLSQIQTAFNEAVKQRVQIHVEKALTEQDADYTQKLEQLLEAVDADHTSKLKKVVQAIDVNRAQKLQEVAKRYSRALTEQANEFKSSLVNQVDRFFNVYLEKMIPAKALNEAVRNKKALMVLENLRNSLGVDTALMKRSLREAIIDGRDQIAEAAQTAAQYKKEALTLKESLEKTRAALVLEQKLAPLSDKKKAYAKRVLDGKSSQFITENIDYTLSLFDKKEEERLEVLKEEAFESRTVKSDRVVIEEEYTPEPVEEKITSPFVGNYLSELGKY